MRHLLIETCAEHAKRLGVDPATVRRRCSNGQLNATKAGKSWLILTAYDDSEGKGTKGHSE